MKKIVYSMLAISAAFMAFSCQKNVEIDNPEAQPGEVKMITVSCTLPAVDPDSKVTLTNDGSVGKTKWENGDEVFFHGKKVGTGYSYVAAAHDVSADGKTAYFTIPDLAQRYNGGSYYRSSLFAAYPASAIETYSSGDEWNYLTAFKETNQLLLAACNDTIVNKNAFTFFNLTGAISFKVSGDFDSYIFEGNNGETIGWGHHTVSFAAGKTDGTIEERYRYKGSSRPYASSSPITSIVVTPTDPDWDNGTTVNTIYFPGTGEYDKAAVDLTDGFTIKFYKNSEEVKRVSASKANNIQIGQLLDLGNITEHLKNPPAHEPAAWTSGATDLSASGTANCYIVYHKDVDGFSGNAGKAFKIRAYKGNTTTSVGTVGGASILWETYGNASSVTANTVIADIDYDSDYIYFKMPAAENMQAGNALIAAKTALGTILWSWHIWVPQTQIGQGTYGISTPNMMDRNLGALKAATAGTDDIQTLGLVYQWGRKDPFVNVKDHAADYDWYLVSDRGAATYPTGVISVSSTMSSIQQSYENPTSFAEGGDKASWLSISDDTLWGASKTEYDPCPVGYKVPLKTDCRLFEENITADTGWAYDPDHYQFVAGTTGNTTVFSIGYVNYNGRFDRPNKRAVIWSATPDVDNRARPLYINMKDSNSYSQYRRSRATGASIRCVEIPSE